MFWALWRISDQIFYMGMQNVHRLENVRFDSHLRIKVMALWSFPICSYVETFQKAFGLARNSCGSKSCYYRLHSEAASIKFNAMCRPVLLVHLLSTFTLMLYISCACIGFQTSTIVLSLAATYVMSSHFEWASTTKKITHRLSTRA